MMGVGQLGAVTALAHAFDGGGYSGWDRFFRLMAVAVAAKTLVESVMLAGRPRSNTMAWIDKIKRWFGTGDPQLADTEVRLIPASANAYGVDLWDCRAFTQSRISGSSDPAVAAEFTRLRTSSGIDHRDQAPDEASIVHCALAYVTEELPEGPLFRASEMEDKWDVSFFRPHIYFARSWSGQLVYKASAHFADGRMEITRIELARGHEPEFSRRVVDYLVKSHVLGAVVPHPLPPDLPTDSMTISVFSFATFGRRCTLGTYADTTILRSNTQMEPARR